MTSPTGVREIDALSGTRLCDTVLDWVEEHASAPTGHVAIGNGRDTSRATQSPQHPGHRWSRRPDVVEQVAGR